MDSILYGNNIEIKENKGISDYFEEYAKLYSDEIALKFISQEFNFKTLNSLSNKFSHYLLKYGIDRNSQIGVCFNRCPELIISIISILKIGCICVPIDIRSSDDAKNSILNNNKINYVISSKFLNIVGDCDNIICDLNFSFPYHEIDANINIEKNINDVAFIFFTSGSTGKPKGVLVSNGGVLNDSLPGIAEPTLSKDDVFLMSSPIDSIRITGEMFYPWFAGASVIILPEENTLDVTKYIELIVKEKISVMYVVSNILREILNNENVQMLSSLRYIQFLGEPLNERIAHKLFDILNVKLINVYGQTETGCCTIKYINTAADIGDNVGTPVNNRIIYIFDESFNLVKKGDIGEVYIGGEGLSLGYVNEFELTEEHYIKKTLYGDKIIYKTGDIGSIINDTLKLEGRIDDMIKIGGKKVNFREIRGIILDLEEVEDASLHRITHNENYNYIVAFIVIKDINSISKLEINNYLKDKLPNYKLPSFYLIKSEIPRLPNGKLNKALINQMIESEISEKNQCEEFPGTLNEILEIIEDVLKTDKNEINILYTFMELGGDSINLASVVLKIEDKFDLEIPYELIVGLSILEISKFVEGEQMCDN